MVFKGEKEQSVFLGRPQPVDQDDLGDVNKYLEGGFFTIAVCAHGIGRSFKHAEELSNRGTPAVFLEGGLEGLDEIADAKRKCELIKAIRAFPKREFLLNGEEVSRYSDLIVQIGGCIVRSDPGVKNCNSSNNSISNF